MTEFQGELKERTPEDYEKITNSIYKHGIAFPFFVWKSVRKKYILDGHGRSEALRLAKENGVKIPPLPVVYIKAKNAEIAKNLLLRLNSRYGTITVQGIQSFIEGADIDISDVNIPELPDLSARLNTVLYESPYYEPPVFQLFCPECGDKYEVTDDELRGMV